MKKILLAIACLSLFASHGTAQQRRYYNEYNSNYNSGYRPRSSWVDDMAYNAPDLYRSYRIGRTLGGLGAGFTIGGLSLAVLGVATAEKETTTNGGMTTVELSGSGGAVFAAGIVFTLVGTPLWIIGGAKKKNTRRTYLREFGDVQAVHTPPSPYVKLHNTSQSMGLALVF